MLRTELTEKIVLAKAAKKLTWSALAQAAGRSEVWTTSALLGQQAMGAAEASACGSLLDLSEDEVALLTKPPGKGSLGGRVPTDPLIYRFHRCPDGSGKS